MRKNQKLEEVLAENLTRLMDTVEGMGTIEKVALRSGLGRGTVDRLKKAEVSGKIETLQALAEAFGVSPLQLLTPALGAMEQEETAHRQPPPAQLQWVGSDEAQLLTDYRNTDDEGRDTIRKIATIVKKVSFAELAGNQPK